MEFNGEITSFQKFRDIVKGITPDERYFFRGEPKDYYELIPKVGRLIDTAPLFGYFNEESIFYRFKNQAVAKTVHIPANDWEWLALAQHHGLQQDYWIGR